MSTMSQETLLHETVILTLVPEFSTSALFMSLALEMSTLVGLQINLVLHGHAISYAE